MPGRALALKLALQRSTLKSLCAYSLIAYAFPRRGPRRSTVAAHAAGELRQPLQLDLPSSERQLPTVSAVSVSP